MPKKILRPALLVFILGLAAPGPGALAGSGSPAPPSLIQQREPLSEASRQWLEEVVPYIITPQEKSVFTNLPTEAERGRFIETFWKKRDPNPRTPENEYKTEYFKRVAQADKLFATGGMPGWRTDRGRIYILLGAPNEIQRDMNPAASPLSGPGFRGPSETWQYWGLANPRLPYNMEFVFVDRFGNGNYVLDTGFNRDSQSRRRLDPASISYNFDYQESLVEAQRNPFEAIDKLKEIITTQVSYDLVPFTWSAWSFKSGEARTYVPVVVSVPLSSLGAKQSAFGADYSLSLILSVSDALGRVVFERSREFRFRDPGKQEVRLLCPLDLEPADDALHILVLDNVTGKMGALHQKLSVLRFPPSELAASEVVLARLTQKREAETEDDLLLESDRQFRPGEELAVFFEVYGLELSPDTGMSRLRVEYSFWSGDKQLAGGLAPEIRPSAEKDRRVRTSFKLTNFQKGSYTLRIRITDEQRGKSVGRDVSFSIVG